MRELVLLTSALVDSDEDAHIVLSREHLNGCAGELGRDLVEATSGQTPFGASDVESADGRMVRGLFGEVRDEDALLVRVRRG